MLDRLLTFVTALLAGSLLASSSVRAASIKETFEKYHLFGTFAWDCGREASEKDNWYFVNRALDADHVQRDYMTARQTRRWFTILDKAEERGSNEIYVSGTLDGKPTNGIWRVEQNRMLQVEATREGKTTIRGGKWTDTGKDMPWLNRCGG